jgi:hypothetical protein
MKLTPSKNDSTMMMCEFCLDAENTATAAVEKAEKVIIESRQNDSKITHREDVMTAVTTSFIELHGAILANPAIPAESKKFALAEEVSSRIKSRDEAIFAIKANLAALENERFAWLKNLQPLVATLRVEEQAKYKQFNLNYKPAEPGIVKVRKVAKAGKAPTPKSGSSKKYTPRQIKEACDAAGVEIVYISNMLLSPKNRDLTIEQVIQKYLDKNKD